MRQQPVNPHAGYIRVRETGHKYENDIVIMSFCNKRFTGLRCNGVIVASFLKTPVPMSAEEVYEYCDQEGVPFYGTNEEYQKHLGYSK